MAILAGGAVAVALLRSSPSGTGTVVGPTLDPSTTLERLALHLQDLPSRFEFVAQVQLDNRATAKLLDEPDKWLRDYESWGRVDGLVRVFNREVSASPISSESVFAIVEMYRSSGGAAQAAGAELSESKKTWADQIKKYGYNFGTLEERRAPTMGDQSTMWYSRASATDAAKRLDMLIFSFRRANVLLQVQWWSFNTGSVLEDDVLQLARKQDELIQAALRGELRPALSPMPTSVAPSLAAPSPTPARQRAVPRTPTVPAGPLFQQPLVPPFSPPTRVRRTRRGVRRQAGKWTYGFD